MINLPKEYEYKNGFLHQKTHIPFEYDLEYKKKQSTNKEMSYLRLGWLSASIPYEKLKNFCAVDVGSGNGEFSRYAKTVFKEICEYDLSGETISKEQLFSTNWDLAVFSDVIEHFPDINEFFEIPWKYALVSFPETPQFYDFNDLKEWRHFKPNEHLWYMNSKSFIKWAKSIIPSLQILNFGYFEDLIRKRWDDDLPNIATILLKR